MAITSKVLTVLVTVLLFGCRSGEPEPARVRVGQFLTGTPGARLTLSGERDSLVFDLEYGRLSAYRTLSPGEYTVEVAPRDGGPVIRQAVGLGAGSRLTLVPVGTVTPGQEVNAAPFLAHLHRAVEGAAAVSARAYLPQLLVVNDYFVDVAGQGNLRLLHLVPGRPPVDLSIRNAGREAVSQSGLGYVHASERERIAAGTYTLAIHLAGSPVRVLRDSLTVRADELTDLFLIAEDAQGNGWQIVSGRTGK